MTTLLVGISSIAMFLWSQKVYNLYTCNLYTFKYPIIMYTTV